MAAAKAVCKMGCIALILCFEQKGGADEKSQSAQEDTVRLGIVCAD
jgi:hypothetical protein